MPRAPGSLLTAEPPKVRMGFVPPSIKKESVKNQLYIFNVGPKIQYGEGASYGRVLIPACLEGKEYSEPYIVPGPPYEGSRPNGTTMDIMCHGEGDGGGLELEDPGFDWACQAILGFTTADGTWNGRVSAPQRVAGEVRHRHCPSMASLESRDRVGKVQAAQGRYSERAGSA